MRSKNWNHTFILPVLLCPIYPNYPVYYYAIALDWWWKRNNTQYSAFTVCRNFTSQHIKTITPIILPFKFREQFSSISMTPVMCWLLHHPGAPQSSILNLWAHPHRCKALSYPQHQPQTHHTLRRELPAHDQTSRSCGFHYHKPWVWVASPAPPAPSSAIARRKR